MIGTVWSLALSACRLLLQLIWPCSLPDMVPISLATTQEQLGRWYFVAAAGESESDLQIYIGMDSTVFLLQEAAETNSLLLSGMMRVGHHCLKKDWKYHIDPHRSGLEIEGRPSLRSLVWSGLWLDCSECIMVQEMEENNSTAPLNRLLLYARNKSVSEWLVQEFHTKASCFGMKAFVALPQVKEYCEFPAEA